jgi:integrase
MHLFKKTVTVFGEKTEERRGVPLTQKAFELLKTRERARPNVRSLKGNFVFIYPGRTKVNFHTLRAAVGKAKIEDYRLHDLRHTFASRLAPSGTDPYTIQTLMGHKSFVTTQRYAHHYSESLRKGIAALDEFRQQKSDFITILSQSAENRS